MKIQLEHNEIKINVELEGIEGERIQKITKNIFNAFLDSIHIVNNDSQTIIVENTIAQNSAESDRIAQKPAAQESPQPVLDPDDPEDNQQAMAEALAAYEKAQAEKLARANMFGLGRIAQKTPAALMEGIPSSAYRQIGGRQYFQAFIICEDCRSKEKHFVQRGTPFVNCKSCGKRNTIRPAALGNFPHIDTFNNIYIGGTFKRADERETEFQAVDA